MELNLLRFNPMFFSLEFPSGRSSCNALTIRTK